MNIKQYVTGTVWVECAEDLWCGPFTTFGMAEAWANDHNEYGEPIRCTGVLRVHPTRWVDPVSGEICESDSDPAAIPAEVDDALPLTALMVAGMTVSKMIDAMPLLSDDQFTELQGIDETRTSAVEAIGKEAERRAFDRLLKSDTEE